MGRSLGKQHDRTLWNLLLPILLYILGLIRPINDLGLDGLINLDLGLQQSWLRICGSSLEALSFKPVLQWRWASQTIMTWFWRCMYSTFFCFLWKLSRSGIWSVIKSNECFRIVTLASGRSYVLYTALDWRFRSHAASFLSFSTICSSKGSTKFSSSSNLLPQSIPWWWDM